PSLRQTVSKVFAVKGLVGQFNWAEGRSILVSAIVLGQSDLAGCVASHPATQQHMRAILQKRNEAQLRISTGSPAGGWPSEFVFVLLGVGDIQRAAVQADQSPGSIPRSARLLRSNRYNDLLIQPPQGFCTKT